MAVANKRTSKKVTQLTVNFELLEECDKAEDFQRLHSAMTVPVKNEHRVGSKSYSHYLGAEPIHDSVGDEQRGGFKPFEDAVDDWYSKVSAHGPLEDGEILASALQLARHFNCEFPIEADWLENFKNRQARKSVYEAVRNGNDSSVMDGLDELEPSSKKRKQILNNLTDLSRNADYPLLLISAQSAHSSKSLSEDKLFVTTRRKNVCGKQQKKFKSRKKTEAGTACDPVSVVDGAHGLCGIIPGPNHSTEDVPQSMHSKGAGLTGIVSGANGHSFSADDAVQVKGFSPSSSESTSCSRDMHQSLRPKGAVLTGAATSARCDPVSAVDQDHDIGLVSTEPSPSTGGIHQSPRPKEGGLTTEVTGPERDSTPAVSAVQDDQCSTASSETSSNPKDELQLSMAIFEDLVFDWYFQVTSKYKTMVSPIIFECKAVEIARSQHLSFQPSKEWAKDFMRCHGIWFIIGDKRLHTVEPIAGLMKDRFDVEFEAWYYGYPVSTVSMLDYGPFVEQPELQPKWKEFWITLYEAQPFPSADMMLAAQNKIAKSVDLTQEEIQSMQNFFREWPTNHECFYNSVKEVYDLNDGLITPPMLQKAAEKWANKYGFQGFEPSELWMRRYFQLHGLRCKESETVRTYMFDATSCHIDTFDCLFRCWRTRGIKVLMKILRDQNYAKIHEEPGDPSKTAGTFTLGESIVIKEEPT